MINSSRRVSCSSSAAVLFSSRYASAKSIVPSSRRTIERSRWPPRHCLGRLDDAQRSAVADEVRQLFDWGAERTPEGVAAAEAKYAELKNRQTRDKRIDVAFALVLNNQRKFHKAVHVAAACLRAKPANIGAHKARIWAELSLRRIEDLISHVHVLTNQLQSSAGMIEDAEDDDLSAVARFLGAVATCVSRLPAEIVDARQVVGLKAEILHGLGSAYAVQFAEGERAVSDSASDTHSQTIKDCLPMLSVERINRLPAGLAAPLALVHQAGGRAALTVNGLSNER